MINVKTVYEASDGQTFTVKEMAENHEEELFNSWLEKRHCMELNSILATFDDEKEDEYFGTERDMVMQFLHRAFELYYQDHPEPVLSK